MKKTLFALALAAISGAVFAQTDNASIYAAEVKPAELKEYLSIIASDALEGRRTGTRGQKMAAAFIAAHFQEIGLQAPSNGSYLQPVELYTSSMSEAWLKAGGTKYDTYGDVAYFGSSESGGEIPMDVVFVGKGAEEDYAQVDVKGKTVLIFVPGKIADSRQGARKLSALAMDKGAKMVMVVSESTNEEFHTYATQVKGFMGRGTLGLNKPDANSPSKGSFMIDQLVAEKIFGTTFAKLKAAADDPKHKSLSKIKPGKASYAVAMTSAPMHTENVLGYLEGSDKKDEVVLVTAHYDHIGSGGAGEDKINNGADDDGSGTVSVLEIAKVFAKAKKEGHGPRRSMVFMTVVGEEQGLFGSEYYTLHPIYPLANTVVDLNIDMIGRSDPEHKDKPDYVYVIGSDKISKQLHEINENQNKTHTQLALDYTYNDENHPTNLYKRSDHWNFAKNNIPIVFYFDGIHEDYHKPSDEVSKINFDLLAKRAQLVFYTAWDVANRQDRLVNDKKQ